jgi:transcriptional regulator with XRE-family HTH domain
MNQNKIGKIIENKRKEKNLTQKELAELLGISNTAISKWENGNNLPDISMLAPLAETLELDLLELISVQNSVHEENQKRQPKIRKIRRYRSIALIIIVVGLICLTSYITHDNTMDKVEEKLNNQVEVYKITSKDQSFRIDGYMIFNNKESIIVLEKVLFQGNEEEYDIEYSNIDTAYYYIYLDNLFIINKKIQITDKKIDFLNDILKSIPVISYPEKNLLNKNKNKFNKSIFKLELHDKKAEKLTIDVEIEISKAFT